MHKLGYLGLVVLGIFPWTVFAAGALKKVWQERLEATSQYAVFLAIWGGSIILFFFFSHSVLVPYLLPIIAPFSIVLALYIDEKWKQKVAMWIRVVFCLACFLLGVGFCIAPYFREMGEGIAVWVHFAWIGILFCALGVMSLWAGAQSNLIFFKTLVIGCVALYTSMLVAMPYANTRSVKPLTDVLKPLMQKESDAKIVAFDEYFQDMPFYLERTVTVVGWKNELTFGIHLFPESQSWMIEVPEFWTMWKTVPVYAIGPLWLYDEAKKQGEVCVLAWTVENLLIVNRSCES
jgi:4-amino-4-deoxy-L-arabinose transferase-like glycosyltransferase